MTMQTKDDISKSNLRALAFLSLAYFVQGTAALSVVGGFDAISTEWHLTPTQIALLVTAFGATFAIGAPLLQMLIGHWVRKTQLLTGLAILAAGAIGFSLAPNYISLFSSRVLMGLGTALISPVVGALGSSLVKPAHQGAALAIVLMGFSISSVIGVPASAWVANHLGPRWMAGSIALLVALAAVLISCFVRDSQKGEKASLQVVASLLKKPATLSGFFVVFFITSGIFSTYTMLSPVMFDLYHAGPETVSTALLIFGVAGVVGNAFVRRASMKWSAETLLRAGMAGLMAIFASLLLTPPSIPLLFLALIRWAFVADMIWPSQQRRIVELEPGYRGIALALTASFMFSGIAVGSALGGWIYPTYGYAPMLAFSILLLAAGSGVLAFSVSAADKLKLKQQTQIPTTPSLNLVPAIVEHRSVKGDIV